MVQFWSNDAGARVRVRNVSVVSTIAASDGTANVYFKDFFPDLSTQRLDQSKRTLGTWIRGRQLRALHKSGILPVFPEEGSVPSNEQPALLAVNQRFRSYGPARLKISGRKEVWPRS